MYSSTATTTNFLCPHRQYCSMTCLGPDSCGYPMTGFFATTSPEIVIYECRTEFPPYFPELEKESIADLKARLSREAAHYWGWLERVTPPIPQPPPPQPKTRNRCCSGSSRHMVRA